MFLITMIYSSSHCPSFLKKNMGLYQFCFAPAIMTGLRDRILYYNKTNITSIFIKFLLSIAKVDVKLSVMDDGEKRDKLTLIITTDLLRI